jgi:hypothetical protein
VATFEAKMMPGQEPYTAAEQEQLAQLVSDAAAGDPGEANEPLNPCWCNGYASFVLGEAYIERQGNIVHEVAIEGCAYATPDSYHCPTCDELPHWAAVEEVAKDGCHKSGGAPQLCKHCGVEYISHGVAGQPACHYRASVVEASRRYCPNAPKLDLTGYAPQGYYDPIELADGQIVDHDDPRPHPARRRPFDAFELYTVVELPDPHGGTFYETVVTPEGLASVRSEAVSVMFTLYGRRPFPEDWTEKTDTEGCGLTAISDFEDHEAALDLAHALALSGGVAVDDYSVPRT